jgi:hypothetical protein
MMMPESGLIPIVTGRRSAIEAVGPKPGRTPTTVPITTPRKAANKFPGVKAMAKPFKSGSTMLSITFYFLDPRPKWENSRGEQHFQPKPKDQKRNGCYHHSNEKAGRPMSILDPVKLGEH